MTRGLDRPPAWAWALIVVGVIALAVLWPLATSREGDHLPQAEVDRMEAAGASAAAADAAEASAAAGCVPADPHLSRTAALIGTDPGSVRVAIVGDSTRDEEINEAAGLYGRLREFHTSERGGLTGVDPANIRGFGSNGAPLSFYMNDDERIATIVAFQPTLIELSIGINDLRLDQGAGPQFQANLVAFVNELHAALPGADVLLSVPGALSTIDVGDKHYVQAADGTVNPPGAAQAVTTTLREAYHAAAEQLGYVGLNDVQEKITGTDADSEEPLRYLFDQLHPTAKTAARVADTIVNTLTGECLI